jgi:hypothetical protein
MLPNINQKVGAIFVNIISIYTQGDKPNEERSSTMTRIMVNDKDLKFIGIIHEQIDPEIIQKKQYLVIHSDINLLHIGYDVSTEERKQKAQRNLTLIERHLSNFPDDNYMKLYKGKTLFMMDKIPDAISYLETIISDFEDSNPFKVELFNYLAELSVSIQS